MWEMFQLLSRNVTLTLSKRKQTKTSKRTCSFSDQGYLLRSVMVIWEIAWPDNTADCDEGKGT
jgi:hypothetical protein